MTRLELQTRIKALRDELESRHKLGTVKTAAVFDGKPVTTKDLQDELFKLVCRLSKLNEEI